MDVHNSAHKAAHDEEFREVFVRRCVEDFGLPDPTDQDLWQFKLYRYEGDRSRATRRRRPLDDLTVPHADIYD